MKHRELPNNKAEVCLSYSILNHYILIINFTLFATDLSHGISFTTQNESEIVNPEPVQIFFTSGTTGDPKMVVHDSTYPFALGITGNDFFEF